jgi:hypothetical protein
MFRFMVGITSLLAFSASVAKVPPSSKTSRDSIQKDQRVKTTGI